MKNLIKNSLIVFVFLLSGSAAIYGQDQTDGQHMEQRKEKLSPEQKAQKQSVKMASKLNLSAEQKRELEALNLEYIKINERKREERKQLKENQATQIRAILTEEQAAQYDELMAKRKNKIKKKGKMKRKNKRGKKQQDNSDLSPEE